MISKFIKPNGAGEIILRPAPSLAVSPEISGVTAMVVDVETTGLNSKTDEIIELAYRPVEVYANCFGMSKAFFADHPIPPKIKALTGICQEDVAGKSIPWEDVLVDFEKADFMVAHNAEFDRGFIEKHIQVKKPWVCSRSDIDWMERGMPEKLELLGFYHGYYTSSHRAISDVDLLINVLTDERLFPHLHEEATREKYMVRFSINPEKKDVLKFKGYRWDPEAKEWWKKIYAEDLETEREIKRELGSDIRRSSVKKVT